MEEWWASEAHKIKIVENEILTLKKAGGGVLCAHGSGDRLPFLAGSCESSVTSWLFQKWCWAKGERVTLSRSWMTVQKMDRVWQKFTNFLRQKSLTSIFFKTLINKTSNFRSNLNYWSSGNFFEVLHASLAQKLTNLEFLTMIFSDVAIGHFARSLRPN